MIFCLNDKAYQFSQVYALGRLCIVLGLFVFLMFSAQAQVRIPPNTAGISEDSDEAVAMVALPNEYASRYKEAPEEPATSVSWYATPQKIASRIPLGEIKVYVRRFQDDTPYLEKTVNEEKGRIFLKETRGLLYRIYDVVFVPYIPLEEYKKTTEDKDVPPSQRSKTEQHKMVQNVTSKDKVETDYVAITKPEDHKTEKMKTAKARALNPNTDMLAETSVSIFKNVNDNEKNKTTEATQRGTYMPNVLQVQEKVSKQEAKTKVPTYKRRDTGRSLFVEIQKLRMNGSVDSLVRYKGKELLFSETYRYTTKGALRTLNRKYSDGALFRLVYYFTSGGLEEEFHQNSDKSIYYKKYTPAGDLKETARYSSDGTLEYKILYRFAKDGTIESEEEISRQVRTYTKYKGSKKYESVRYQKTTADDGKETEAVIARIRYDYGETTNTAFNENAEFLHEKNSESFFDKDGTLIKKREYVDFELTKEIQYQKNDVKIETYFVKDKPVFRIRYVGARKESEEML